MTNVTQADRIAASRVLSSAITKEVLRGDYDSREIVQAFAAHRIATIAGCALAQWGTLWEKLKGPTNDQA